MHFSHAAAPVLLASFAASVHGQDASPTTSEEPSGTAALEIEEQRAECFKMCYREYGNTASCPFVGEEYFMACWCTVDDWTSREEDCVWDECSPDAYNNYHIIRPRMCETVAIPSSSPTPASTASEISQSAAEETTTGSASTESSASETSSETASPTGEDAAQESEDPNGSGMLTWTSASAAGLIVGVAYLIRFIL